MYFFKLVEVKVSESSPVLDDLPNAICCRCHFSLFIAAYHNCSPTLTCVYLLPSSSSSLFPSPLPLTSPSPPLLSPPVSLYLSPLVSLVIKAEACYERALGLFQHDAHLDEATRASINKVRVALFSNMAACRSKLEDDKGAMLATGEALKIDG